jgi:hypothetical protein
VERKGLRETATRLTAVDQHVRVQKETMPAVLETTTFGELPDEPKTNALPLRQGTYWLLDEITVMLK